MALLAAERRPLEALPSNGEDEDLFLVRLPRILLSQVLSRNRSASSCIFRL